MTGTTIKLRLRDLSGRPREVEFTEEGDFSSPGSSLRQRLVSTNGNRFVLKSVPPDAGARAGALFQQLDSEIRVGARLGYVYHHYPAELARLAGYNVDVEEPFALLHAYTGRPVAELTGGLDDQRRRQLQIGLLRALQLTAAAGVVHGAVSVRHLWWNGAGVRLVDFESAQWAGEPRRAGAEPGPADARDDVLQAGRLIRQLALGDASGRTDHTRDPESLRILLHGVFQPVAQRLYAEELLRRLKVPVIAPPVTDPEARLSEGRRIFDGFGPPPDPVPVAGGGDDDIVPPRPTSARKRGVWRRFVVPMLLAAMAGRVGPR